MYKKARNGEIKDFTGVSSPYEAPENPNIHVKNDDISIEEASEVIIRYLNEKKLIKIF